jgi:hypothetical protein
MKRLLLSAVATALLLTPLACDLGKISDQITAEKVMVGTVFATPPVDIYPAALAGLDGGTLPDGGPWGEPVTVPGQTAALVFFGTRDSESGLPEPISNATVRLEVSDGGTQPLDNQGAGTYSHTSDSNEPNGLKYKAGATYRFVAATEGQSYTGAVEDAPGTESIAALHPQGGYIRHTANQELVLERPAVPSGQKRNIGFVTVVPVDTEGNQGPPTYTTLPSSPLALLQVVAAPVEWQQARVTLPGTAFPDAKKTYLIIFQSVRAGTPESNNLFIGSALLAGAADIGVLRTQ